VDDTLRRNIALGLEDDEVDETALTRAVELAQLDDFVTQLPAGLDTVVGERGVRVSGGQRQRIAIARALYRQPGVLVFDEGTSALDNATESALIGALERLRGRHTIILVAHRLSTVRNSDHVVYVEGGRIAGVGPFYRLQRASAKFRALADESSPNVEEDSMP
jgi:ATP-binding cassette, subfamily B, bacterial PglK